MSRIYKIWAIGMLACAFTGAWAQDAPAPPDNGQPQAQEPVPAYGQDNTPATMSENPPLSGLDQPTLEPHAAPLSYLQPGATASESADSNVTSTPGSNSFISVSRAIGSLALRRLWSHYDLALDDAGGVAYYNLKGQGWKGLEQADLDQKITWKRGQFSVRDSFSYLPEGNFGEAYGALGSAGITSLGNTAFGSFWGGSALGSLGLAPRILNVSLADVTESLTPKSSVTAAGGYAFTHFYGNQTNGNAFFGSSQVSAQVGYNRILTSHTQVALVYGYQGFDFNAFGTAFHSHIIQGMYGHRINGRMDLLIAAGPQFTHITLQQTVCSDPSVPTFLCTGLGDTLVNESIPDSRIGVAGQFRLRYRFTRTDLDLRYERFETSGSGLFAGAQTDVARLTATRPLSRIWTGEADIGFSRNSRLQSLTPAQLASCVYPGQPNSGGLPLCPGVNANTYEYGFAGVALHRQFGRTMHGFISYEFNELSFDQSFCAGTPQCSRISNRQIVTIGLD